jgi:threonine aldolase
VGSLLCGSRDFIDQARRIRKQVGGGMRQAGILAAAGIVALEKMVDRLPEDHANARRLAQGLSQIEGIVLDPGTPFTNMVFFELAPNVKLDAPRVAERLGKKGVRAQAVGPRRFRCVLHYWVDASGVDRAVEGFREVLAAA